MVYITLPSFRVRRSVLAIGACRSRISTELCSSKQTHAFARAVVQPPKSTSIKLAYMLGHDRICSIALLQLSLHGVVKLFKREQTAPP